MDTILGRKSKRQIKDKMNDDKKDNIFNKDKTVVSFEYDPALFHADYSIYILYRRIDNMTAALFLVTNSLQDNEMLKASLRQASLDCLSGIISFIGSSKADALDLQHLVAHILELSSKLNIAFWSGLISDMNASVLQKEIVKIHETVAEVISKYRSALTLDPLLFSRVDLDIRQHKNALQHQHSKHSDSYIKDIYNKGQIKGHIKDIKLTTQSPNTPFYNNKDPNDIDVENDGVNNKNKDERRAVILKLLSERSNLSIKDFATVIISFSEKTIQRELLSLVEDGVVKKEGERRWSTYSLNSAA